VGLTGLHRRLSRREERGAERLLIPPLAALSLLYRLAVAGRNLAYDRGWMRSERLAAWVLVVGGLSAGGSGKTPLAAELARRIARWGVPPLIVARAYRAAGFRRGALLVADGAGGAEPDPLRFGDEAALLARLAPGIPVAIARRRAEVLRDPALAELGARALVLDGGLQHRRLRPDLALATIDASLEPSSGRLLPLGDLREPWTALRRADWIVLHRGQLCPDPLPWERFLDRVAPGRPRLWTHTGLQAPEELGEGRVTPWPELRGRRLGLWTGLGHPEALVADLAAEGVVPAWRELAPDHARCDAALARRLRRAAARERLEAILVTLKDAVKLEAWRDALPPVLVCRSGIGFGRGLEAFEGQLRASLRAAGVLPAGDPPCAASD